MCKMRKSITVFGRSFVSAIKPCTQIRAKNNGENDAAKNEMGFMFAVYHNGNKSYNS